MFKILLVVLSALIGAAAVSGAFGLMDSHADLIFLMLLIWWTGVTLLRGAVINKIDKTNGNDTGSIAYFFYVIIAVICILAACMAALMGVNAFTSFVLGAVLITAAAGATAWMHT